MKKTIAVALSLAACTCVYAEDLKVLSMGLGVPGIDEPQLMGMGISPNGKYVCGTIEMGFGIFAANTETGEVKWHVPEGDGDSHQLRNVDDNGLCIGITEEGIYYSFETGEVTPITVPNGWKRVIGEDLTENGGIVVGSLSSQSYTTYGAYTTDGKIWNVLPLPTKEELGGAYRRIPEGSAAKLISEDGNVIYGCLGSYTLPMLWVKNDKGEYETDFFLGRYLADGIDENKVVYGCSAIYGLSLSPNGKYATFLGQLEDERTVPMVYDTQKKELKIYSEVQPIDETHAELYPCAICDDGTFIGTIGLPYFNQYGTFIMKAGETVAESYLEAFPEYKERFEVGDYYGFNMPTGMSASGRYIMGYTFYADDYMDQNSDAYYVTYIIDRGDISDVNEISTEMVAPVQEAIYTIDGQRVNTLTKGINIIRMSDGTTRKVLNK